VEDLLTVLIDGLELKRTQEDSKSGLAKTGAALVSRWLLFKSYVHVLDDNHKIVKNL
jgi:hypothetical protein